MNHYSIDVDLAPGDALDLLAKAVADWGGEWRTEDEEHALWLPVSAGLRRGFVAARAEATAEGPHTRVEIRQVESQLHINRGAAGVLAFGALGGIVAMLWPFFPGLLKIAPLAAVLAVVAWLMVAGRLRNSGLEEFVEALQATAETDDGESTPAA